MSQAKGTGALRKDDIVTTFLLNGYGESKANKWLVAWMRTGMIIDRFKPENGLHSTLFYFPETADMFKASNLIPIEKWDKGKPKPSI